MRVVDGYEPIFLFRTFDMNKKKTTKHLCFKRQEEEEKKKRTQWQVKEKKRIMHLVCKWLSFSKKL